MPYEIVHTIGSTVYFVFFLLFLWVRRTPRINPGAGWWAAAMAFALAARLVLVTVFGDQQGHDTAVAVYTAISAVAKFCLMVGLVRFFEVPVRLRGFWIALLAIEAWIVVAWSGGMSPLLRDGGVALFNAIFQLYAGWIVLSRRQVLAPRLLSVTALASVLLALCLSPFLMLAAGSRRQRLPLVALMALLSYAVPVVGFVGSVIATVALLRRRGLAARREFSSLPLPEFDPHQQASGSRRQAGLQSFLANQAVPVPLRMRSLAALGHVSGRIASPMLRMALSDSSDDLRLLAYSMLDAQERQLSQSIHQELQALERARAVEGSIIQPPLLAA